MNLIEVSTWIFPPKKIKIQDMNWQALSELARNYSWVNREKSRVPQCYHFNAENEQDFYLRNLGLRKK